MFKIIMGSGLLPEGVTPDWMRDKLLDIGHTPGSPEWAQSRVHHFRASSNSNPSIQPFHREACASHVVMRPIEPLVM